MIIESKNNADVMQKRKQSWNILIALWHIHLMIINVLNEGRTE